MKKRSPKEEYIYNELKQAIFNRRIPVNTQLNEEALSDAFHVSRTPIRAVLKRMQHEKLVQNIPNKGTYIYQPTLKRMEEVFHFRSLLEKEAIRVACKEATEEQLQELEQRTYLEEKYYINGDYANGLKLTSEFHQVLIDFLKNELITEYYTKLINITNVYLVFHEIVDKKNPLSPVEHRAVIEAIRSKDEEQAVDTLLQHFKNIGKHLQDKKKEEIVKFDEIFKPYSE